MPRFETPIIDEGYKKEGRSVHHGGGEIDSRIFRKETKEIDYAKEKLESVLSALVSRLNNKENYLLLNEIAGEGAVDELTGKLEEYFESVKNKHLISESSALDVLENLETSLFGFLSHAQKGKEQFKERVRKDFSSLEKYVELIYAHKHFEKAEMEHADGYLGMHIEDKDDLKKFRLDKSKYVAECERLLTE